MKTWVKTKDGRVWLLWSDNIDEETMDLISVNDCDNFGNYDPEWISSSNFKYSEIDRTDTNRAALGV